MEDNKTLAESVANNINYTMLKDALVKPLEPVMVTKQFTAPVVKEKKDDEGLEVNDYEETTTETKEVESMFERGVILKLPLLYKDDDIKVGDIVVYNKRFAIEFDVFKNSKLVKTYDIVAKED